MIIITNDNETIKLTEYEINEFKIQSEYFDVLSSGRWGENNEITIPYSADEFSTFLKYIINQTIPNDKNYHIFQKMTEYFCLKKNFKDCSLQTLFKLRESDSVVRQKEIHLRKEIINGLITDDSAFKLKTHKREKTKYIEKFFSRKHNFETIKKLGVNSYYEKDDFYHYLTVKKNKTSNFFTTILDPDFYRDMFQKLKTIYPDLPIVMAGGSVLNIYNNIYLDKNQDVDIFFITKNISDIFQSIEIITRFFKENYNAEIVFMRTENAISIFVTMKSSFYSKYTDRIFFGKTLTLNFQFILRLYSSIGEIITGFDIDCCCVAFDGKEYYGTDRFLRSNNNGVIIADPERQSTTYSSRLYKYASRGFAIVITGLDLLEMNSDIFYRKENKGLASILTFFEKNMENDKNSDYMDDKSIMFSKIMINNKISLEKFLLKQYFIATYYKKTKNILGFIISDTLSNLMKKGRNAFRLDTDKWTNNKVLKNIIKNRVFFRHWVKFNPIVYNPSKQQTGSFNPTYDEWFIDLYL